MFCGKCGTPMNDGMAFCPNCGAAAVPNPLPSAAACPPAPQQPAGGLKSTFRSHDAFSAQSAAQQQPIAAQPQPAAVQPQPIQTEPVRIAPEDLSQAAPTEPVAAVPVNLGEALRSEPYVIDAKPKKRSLKKPLIISACAVVLLAVIGVGIWLLTRKDKGSEQLPTLADEVKAIFLDLNLNPAVSAAEKTEAALDSYLAALPNLNTVRKNAEAITASPIVGVDVQADIEGVNVTMNGAMDRSGQRMNLSGSAAYGEKTVSGAVYADTTQIQIASEELLGTGAVYMLPLTDLSTRWNSSALSRMLGVRIPSYIDTDKLIGKASGVTADGIQEKLAANYGSYWTDFKASVKMTQKTDSTAFTESGTVYVLEWDSDLLAKMKPQAEYYFENLDLEVDDPEGLAALLDLDLNEAIGHALIMVFSSCDQEGIDMEILVDNNGCLVGASFMSEQENEGNQIKVLLCGETNIWECITVTERSWYSTDARTYENEYVGTIRSRISGSRLEITISSSRGTGYEMYEQTLGSLVYDDTNGRIMIYDENGRAQLEGATISIQPEGSGITLQVKQSSAELRVTLKPDGKIGALSANPTDILAMSEQELQDLVRAIEQRVADLSDDNGYYYDYPDDTWDGWYDYAG